MERGVRIMSEELLQKDLLKNPEKIGRWNYYNIGATTIRQLKECGIIRNVDYGKLEKKKVDGLLVLNKVVIAVIEFKKPSEFNTDSKKQKAIKQELEVAKKLKTKLLIATDTNESIWINVLTGRPIKDEYGNAISLNFDPKSASVPETIDKIYSSINEKNDTIKPIKLVNPTDLAKQIWQDVWSVSGSTPENCLYTFIELFIFKYLSDLGILPGTYSFYTLFQSYKSNTEEDVLETYANTIRPKIKTLFPANMLDNTTIINGTIFVSKDQQAVKGYSGVFRKILTRFMNYGILEHIDCDFKSKLFESFLKESISKKNWGQFFTPLKVVRAIGEMAKDDICAGMTICDPACGVGKFLLEPIAARLEEFYKIENGKLKSNITIKGFDKGFDKDEQKTIILAKANMLIYFSDLIKQYPNNTKEFASLFNESFLLKTNSILGTLSEPVKNEYDLIFTNPPYVMSGSSNLKEEIRKNGNLVNHYKINGMGIEGLFMEWIVRALKPKGKAFVVVPDGMFNRQNDSRLRKFILDECYLDGVISLPLNTFFRTNKKTYILCITKKALRKDVQAHPVFTYLVSEIGETRDIYRFETEQNDLQEAVTLYSFFKGNKARFKQINTDKRCKIQPISVFNPNEHWSIDRWWTEQEKIEIGITEEKKILSTLEYGEYIGEVADCLYEWKQLLEETNDDNEYVASNNNSKTTRKVSLSDKNLFELFLGKRLLKKDLIKIEGSIPIYSANVFTPWSYHYESNISDFSNDFVIWGIDGYLDFNHLKKGIPFTTTDHCGAIRIKGNGILPEYLITQLYSVKEKYGFDRTLRASLRNMKSIEIYIPIDKDGNWDVEKQELVVEKYAIVRELQNTIREHESKLEALGVSIKPTACFQDYSVDSLFDIIRGKSCYTKSYGNNNPGEYPVFSASNKALTCIDSYDFDGKYITWSTNGFAGYIKLHEGKFSINADRGLLSPILENININFVKYTLEPLLRSVARGRKGDRGDNEFTKVYPSMIKDIQLPMPIDKDGNLDLEKQNMIASEYKTIEQIRTLMRKKLLEVLTANISYE